MISKALIKHIRSLHQSKFRNEHNQFIAEGPKVVKELLHSRFSLITLCATTAWIEEHATEINASKAEVISVSPAELERISALSTPNQVLAVFEYDSETSIPAIDSNELILVLEHLRDPGNLGTIIRIADWFGIKTIICSEQTVDVYNPKTVQSTMGSLARVNVHYTELEALLQGQHGKIPIIASVLKGENISTASLPKGGLLLIGSESHGLSEALISLSSQQITIPAFHSSQDESAESLNASIAAALMCYEFRRRL